jgi:hypothetical protein
MVDVQHDHPILFNLLSLPETLMQSLVLSQSGLYQLQQLSRIVLNKTGIRHRLSDTKSIISLLRYSSTSPDETIFRYFSRFTKELDIEQRIYLQGRGLLLPDVIYEKIDTMPNERTAT